MNLIDIPSPGLQEPHMKPRALVDYLLLTYTNPGDVVLDPAMHKGIVGHRCAALQRGFVGIEAHGAFFEEAAESLHLSSSDGKNAAS